MTKGESTFTCETHFLGENRRRYTFHFNGKALSFGQVLQWWQAGAEFSSYFSRVLAEAPFDAFRWETPGISRESLEQGFEFVLLDASHFLKRKTDFQTYARYFSQADREQNVAFKNLSGDATLVTPVPQMQEHSVAAGIYGHLASFVRAASSDQVTDLWRLVAETAMACLQEQKRIWISTAGGGVAWLHVRIDSSPKYYGYVEYRENCS